MRISDWSSDVCSSDLMAMKTCPLSPFKMVETEFFLELLMGLLADPARLDGAGDIPDRRICGQVREIIFALAAGAMLADQPCFFPGHVLRDRGADALRRAVGDRSEEHTTELQSLKRKSYDVFVM